jgi:hypothetical protein
MINPSDINTNSHFWDAFGNNETEVSANYIVRFCQERGHWEPFTLAEIEAFYQRTSGHQGFSFNRLLGGPYQHMTAASFPWGETRQAEAFILKKNGQYVITSEFIERCYNSSPVR